MICPKSSAIPALFSCETGANKPRLGFAISPGKSASKFHDCPVYRILWGFGSLIVNLLHKDAIFESPPSDLRRRFDDAQDTLNLFAG